MYQFSYSILRFTMILICSTFLMNLSRNNQDTAILKIIKISRKCHGRFTANYSKFLASYSIQREMWYNFTPTLLKIWKIWALFSLSKACKLEWEQRARYFVLLPNNYVTWMLLFILSSWENGIFLISSSYKGEDFSIHQEECTY